MIMTQLTLSIDTILSSTVRRFTLFTLVLPFTTSDTNLPYVFSQRTMQPPQQQQQQHQQ